MSRSNPIQPGCIVHGPTLTISAEQEPFDGDARLFRLGVVAHRLGLAYEYDPFFSLSIARVDPLPHQLEAVYDFFLRLPRIRFLLADDPGAGKTIAADRHPYPGIQSERHGDDGFLDDRILPPAGLDYGQLRPESAGQRRTLAAAIPPPENP